MRERELLSLEPQEDLVDLAVEGEGASRRLALVQEVQHHPLSGKVLHVDFHQVAEDEKVTVTVPVETSGDVFYGFFASIIDFLADRPGIGIRPREPGIYVMKSDIARQGGRMVLLPGWLLTLGTLGIGAGIWVVRRR